MLLGSRILEGIGMGLIAVVGPTSIAIWLPREKQGIPMGLWATWVPIGSVVMYNLAPALATSVGWQAVWWAGAAIALIALILYAMFMRLPSSFVSEPRFKQGDPIDNPSPGLRQVLASRDIWLLSLQFGCYNPVIIAFASFFPTFLSEERNYSLAQAAFISSLATMVVLGSAPLAGWLSDRIGSRRLILAIPFLVIAGMMIFPFTLNGWTLYLFLILLGIITGAVPTATFAAAPEVMDNPQFAGIGLAVVSIGQNLGMVIGPILFGMLVETMGWVTAGYWLIPICLLGFGVGWLVKVR